jgi:predicted dehydrogenase
MNGMEQQTMTRRELLRRSAAVAAVAAATPLASRAYGDGGDKVRLGLIGAGNRGTGAVMDAIISSPNVVENLVHNIDVMNWVMGGPPISATAMGGHANWDDWPIKGNVYDHFYVEFEYPGGVKIHASSRQTKNTSFRIGERVIGSKGIANPFGRIKGQNAFDFPGPFDNPRFILWAAYIESIRKGEPLNTGKEFAQSTMTAILGRMSAYTGRAINYNWVMNASNLDLAPPKYEFGPLAFDPPAVPGRAPLI